MSFLPEARYDASALPLWEASAVPNFSLLSLLGPLLVGAVLAFAGLAKALEPKKDGIIQEKWTQSMPKTFTSRLRAEIPRPPEVLAPTSKETR